VVQPFPSSPEYEIAIMDMETHQPLRDANPRPSGGFFSFAQAAQDAREAGPSRIVRALWHPRGHVVAITDAGTAHSRELYLYEVRGSSAFRLVVPDYEQNALGRVGATATADTADTELERWDGDVLRFRFTFRPLRSDHANQSFVVEISLRLQGSDVVLESVGMPTLR
jgi:hypothetical protein